MLKTSIPFEHALCARTVFPIARPLLFGPALKSRNEPAVNPGHLARNMRHGMLARGTLTGAQLKTQFHSGTRLYARTDFEMFFSCLSPRPSLAATNLPLTYAASRRI